MKGSRFCLNPGGGSGRWAFYAAALLALLTAGPAFSGPATPGASAAHMAARIDPIVEASRRELHLPGVSVAIMRGHDLVLAKGYGEADHAAGTPATDRTVYAIGSLSKQVTAAGIMRLHEQGRLALDDPVSKYLPEYRPAPGPGPTIRNLLRQDAGLIAWDDLPQFEDLGTTEEPQRFELPRLAEAIARQPPQFAPGTWWSYSNSNYTLLAAVIERVSGRRHDEYLQEALFDRLGLRSMAGCGAPRAVAPAAPRAPGYQDSRSYELRPVTPNKAKAFTGAGGLCANVVDLAAWMRALADGQAVSAESFRQMTTPAPVTAGFTPPYGFGVSLLPLAGQRAVWHTGVLSGYTAIVAWLPEHDLVIAALTNARRAHLDQLVKDIVGDLLGLPAAPLKDLPIEPALAARVAGEYDDRMFRFPIFRKGAELFVDVPPAGGPTRLLYQGGGEFATGRPTGFRFRFEPETGDVERVVWEWTELRAYGRRVR